MVHVRPLVPSTDSTCKSTTAYYRHHTVLPHPSKEWKTSRPQISTRQPRQRFPYGVVPNHDCQPSRSPLVLRSGVFSRTDKAPGSTIGLLLVNADRPLRMQSSMQCTESPRDPAMRKRDPKRPQHPRRSSRGRLPPPQFGRTQSWHCPTRLCLLQPLSLHSTSDRVCVMMPSYQPPCTALQPLPPAVRGPPKKHRSDLPRSPTGEHEDCRAWPVLCCALIAQGRTIQPHVSESVNMTS